MTRQLKMLAVGPNSAKRLGKRATLGELLSVLSSAEELEKFKVRRGAYGFNLIEIDEACRPSDKALQRLKILTRRSGDRIRVIDHRGSVVWAYEFVGHTTSGSSPSGGAS